MSDFQEYPRLLYKGEACKRVNSDDEKKAALKDDWALLPGQAPVLEPVDEAVVDAEIAPKAKPKKAKA